MKIKTLLVTSAVMLCVFLPSALAIEWDYVYDCSRFPIDPDAVTDENCISVSGWSVLNYGDFNTTVNSDATVTIDDTVSSGATVYYADITSGLWSNTEKITAEFKIMPHYFNVTDDGITFLQVENHQAGFGFRWWLYTDENGDFILWGEHQIGDPNARQERLVLGPPDQWYTLRLNYDQTDLFARPVLYAWDENGVPAADPEDILDTDCQGYDIASSTSRLAWGDIVSAADEGSVSYGYIRWLIGETYGPEVTINEPAVCPCQRYGYLDGDLNEDCRIDILDFEAVSKKWQDCTDPLGVDCQNAYGNVIFWEYLYECDDLPAVTGVITDADGPIGQWSGPGAVTSPDGVVSVSGGVLEINDLGISGSHYCQVEDTSGLWSGPGSTVDIRMKLKDHTGGNAFVLQVSDGMNYHRWFISEKTITNGAAGAINIDMTRFQVLRVSYPQTGTPALCVHYNGSEKSLPAYTGTYSTPAHLRFGDGWSNETGHLSYDYIRWTTRGAYDLDTIIAVP